MSATDGNGANGGHFDTSLAELTDDYLTSLDAPLSDAVLRAAILRWFSPSVLEVVRENEAVTAWIGAPDRSEPSASIFERLKELPFVEEYFDGRYMVHSATRGVLLGRLWEAERPFFNEISGTAANYFSEEFQPTGPDGTPSLQGFVADADDLIETIYHLTPTADEAAIGLASQALDIFLQVRELGPAFGIVLAMEEHVDAGRSSPAIALAVDWLKARIALAGDRVEEAATLAQQVFDRAQQQGDDFIRRQAADVSAAAASRQGRKGDAVRWYEAALETGELEPETRASLSLKLGRALAGLSRYDRAEAAFLSALDSMVPTMLDMPAQEAAAGTPTPESEPDALLRDRIRSGDIHLDVRNPEAWTKEDEVIRIAIADGSDSSVAAAITVNVDATTGTVWQRLADLYATTDRAREAHAAAGVALQIASVTMDRDLATSALSVAQELSVRFGDSALLEHSYEFLTNVVSEAAAAGNYEAEVDALLQLGTVHVQRREYQTARGLLERARGLTQARQDRMRESGTNALIGRLEWAAAEFDEAESSIREAIRIANVHGYQAIEASYILMLGQLHQRRGQWKLAEQRYVDALELQRSLESPQGEFEAVVALVDFQDTRFRLAEAAGNAQRAVELAQESATPSQTVDVMLSVASIQSSMRWAAQAAETFDQTMQLATSIGAKSVMANVKYSIGGSAMLAGNWDRAREAFLEARALVEGQNEAEIDIAALLGLAAVARLTQRTDESVAFGEEALAVARAAVDRSEEFRIRTELARGYAESGRSGQAEELLRDVVKAEADNAEVVATLGWVRLIAGKDDEARDQFQRAMELDSEDSSIAFALAHAILVSEGAERANDAYRQALARHRVGENLHAPIAMLIRLGMLRPEHQGRIDPIVERLARAQVEIEVAEMPAQESDAEARPSPSAE